MKTPLGLWPYGLCNFLAQLRPIEADIRSDWRVVNAMYWRKADQIACIVRPNPRSGEYCGEVARCYLRHPGHVCGVTTYQIVPIAYVRRSDLAVLSNYQRLLDRLIYQDWGMLLGESSLIFPLGTSEYIDGGLGLCIMLVNAKPHLVLGKLYRRVGEVSDVWVPSLKRSILFSERDRGKAARFSANLRRLIDYIESGGLDHDHVVSRTSKHGRKRSLAGSDGPHEKPERSYQGGGDPGDSGSSLGGDAETSHGDVDPGRGE